MATTLRTKLKMRIGIAINGLLVASGILAVPAPAISAPTFEEASSENTAEAYAEFILGGGDPDLVDEAFCRLSGIDSAAAEATAASYTDTTDTGVDFATCASSGSARLFII